MHSASLSASRPYPAGHNPDSSSRCCTIRRAAFGSSLSPGTDVRLPKRHSPIAGKLLKILKHRSMVNLNVNSSLLIDHLVNEIVKE